MISAFIAVFFAVCFVVTLIVLVSINKQLQNSKFTLSKYNTLNENYEELKVAYDNLSDKYYLLMEENTNLERKIDEYEEQILSDQIEKDLNEE